MSTLNVVTERAASDESDFSLPSWLRAVFALDPEAPVLQFGGTWRPWSALGTALQGLDAALEPHGWGEATRVGVVMRNRPEVVRAVAAVVASGRCLVTLSSTVPAAALAAELRRLSLPVILASAADWSDELQEAARDRGSLGLAFDDDAGPARVVMQAGVLADEHLTRQPGVAVEMLTSGTTGTPKRVDLLYRSLEHEIVSTASYSSSSDLAAPRLATGCAIIWNPLLHIGGLRALITNLVAGRRIALLERFSVHAWAELVREHRPKALSLVPSAMRMVLDADVPSDVFHGVQAVLCGTAPLPPETAEEFERRHGVPVLVVYGATEFAGGVAGWTIRDWREFGAGKRGSVGRANPGVEVRFVDQRSGDVLPNGEVGLLEVRAPQLASEGWMRTTDLGRIDDDGFIWIEGRADDVIIRGGFKVATNAVADVLRRHPAVLDVCVVGLPDDRLGQVPVAAVELAAGADTGVDDLAAWAHQQLAGYQVPVRFKIVRALPRTPSLKVSQPGVRELFLDESP